jgi:hypothetical protein
MAINETLRQRSPCILGRVVAHVAIVPRDSRAAFRCSGSPAGGFEPRVTCVGLSVKALLAWGSGPQALVKVERPQRSEDVRP